MGDIIHRFLSDINIVVTESTGELSILFVILLLFVIVVFTGFYVYNRTKNLTKLSKQIPASLVRAHLNSIIKNSKDLKDSLFLGDGEDPLNESKNDILALRDELKEKEKIIKELSEKKDTPTTSGTSALGPEMEKIIKERDDLLLRISDYQKVEEDFVNLKKLKEENEELKAKLGIKTEEPKIVEAVQSEEKKSTEEKPEAKEAKTEEELPKEDLEKKSTEEIEAIKEPKKEEELTKEEKSAEELLKEFEKMLGQ